MAIFFQAQQPRERRKVCGEIRCGNCRGFRPLGALQGRDGWSCIADSDYTAAQSTEAFSCAESW